MKKNKKKKLLVVGLLFAFCVAVGHRLSGMLGVELDMDMRGKNPYMTDKKVEKVKNLFKTNPTGFLGNCVALGRAFQKNNYSEEALKELSRNNPVFLLFECEEKHCFLTRKNNPKPREKYEDAVSGLVKKSFADVGSSDLFQTAVILSRVLNKNPKSSPLVYLVDLRYKEYINSLKELGSNRVSVSNFIWSVRFWQFVTFFKVAYPDSKKMRFFVYDCVQALIEDCKNKMVPVAPEVIISSDHDKQDTEEKGIINDCVNLLCFSAETRKGTASNIILTKRENSKKKEAELLVVDAKWDCGEVVIGEPNITTVAQKIK